MCETPVDESEYCGRTEPGEPDDRGCDRPHAGRDVCELRLPHRGRGRQLRGLLSSASANVSIGCERTVVAVAIAVAGAPASSAAAGRCSAPWYSQYIAAGVALAIALVVTSRRGSQPGRRTT